MEGIHKAIELGYSPCEGEDSQQLLQRQPPILADEVEGSAPLPLAHFLQPCPLLPQERGENQ